MNIRRIAATALISFVALLGTGCSDLEGIELPDIDIPTSSAPSEESDSSNPTAEGCEAGAEYDRDCFGESWADVDNNDCDTRNDILARDLEAVELDTDNCTVLSGTLVSPYTGETIDFTRGQSTSAEVPIDHVVPLSWAWQNGADEWTDEEREAFANDPENLIAVDRTSNSAKSDSGPADWMPSNDAYSCEYANDFQDLTNDYDLELSSADVEVINAAC